MITKPEMEFFFYYQKFCLILNIKEQNFCTLCFVYHLGCGTATSTWDISHSKLSAEVHENEPPGFGLVTLSFHRIEYLKSTQPYTSFHYFQVKIVGFVLSFALAEQALGTSERQRQLRWQCRIIRTLELWEASKM